MEHIHIWKCWKKQRPFLQNSDLYIVSYPGSSSSIWLRLILNMNIRLKLAWIHSAKVKDCQKDVLCVPKQTLRENQCNLSWFSIYRVLVCIVNSQKVETGCFNIFFKWKWSRRGITSCNPAANRHLVFGNRLQVVWR